MKKGVLVAIVFFGVLVFVAALYALYFGYSFDREPLLQPVGNVIYVDNSLENNGYDSECMDYDFDERTCGGGGSDTVYSTISDALAVAVPGDTISVREGTFMGVVDIGESGTSGNPITLRAEPGEVVTIDADQNPHCIFLGGNSYFIVDGFTCLNVDQAGGEAGVYLDTVDSVTVRNMEISDANRGVYGVSSANLVFERIHIHDVFEEGMFFDGVTSLLVDESYIAPMHADETSTLDCISVQTSDSVEISSTVLHHCGDAGIEISEVTNFNIYGNFVSVGGGVSELGSGIRAINSQFEGSDVGYNIVHSVLGTGLYFEGGYVDDDGLRPYHNLVVRSSFGYSFDSGNPTYYVNNLATENNDGEFSNLGELDGILDPEQLNQDSDSDGYPDVFEGCESQLPDVSAVLTCVELGLRSLFGIAESSAGFDSGDTIVGVNDGACGANEDQYCYNNNQPDYGPFELNVAVPECSVDADCDDALFCNGVETCQAGSCVAGSAACAPGELCSELNDVCNVECVNDAQCDDGLFCNGAEFCNAQNECEWGTPPICDDGLFCNGEETCDEGADECSIGFAVQPCFGVFGRCDSVCNEIIDQCNVPLNEMCVETGNVCDPNYPGGGVDGVGCYVDLSVACDGVALDIGEQCDGTFLNSETCESLGYPAGGTLGCTSGCTFDVSSCLLLPKWDTFDQDNTTNFSAVGDITSVDDAVLQKSPYGKIDFIGRTASFERLDLDKNIIIEQSRIGIVSEGDLMFRVNIPAEISFYGITVNTPVIQKDGVDCSAPDCVILDYDTESNILLVRVRGFSEYTVVDANPPDTIDTGNPPGGGGPSGPGPTPSDDEEDDGPTCDPLWQCSDWGECSVGTQTRVCTDVYLCGDAAGKPREIRECGDFEDLGFESDDERDAPTLGERITNVINPRVFLVSFILGSALIAIVVSGIILFLRRREEQRKKQDVINRVVVQNGWEGLR